MIRHMRHGSSPRLMTPQPIRGPNRREALATPSAGDRITGALHLLSEMPFGLRTSRLAWELKVLGLVVIFTYAFYKFAWSYRLSNYAAILIGAVLPHDDPALRPAEAARAANMNVVAGRHFTRGLQAFFFALAYLGWFIGPWVLIGSTALVLVIVWRRQFASDALAALSNLETSARSKH